MVFHNQDSYFTTLTPLRAAPYVSIRSFIDPLNSRVRQSFRHTHHRHFIDFRHIISHISYSNLSKRRVLTTFVPILLNYFFNLVQLLPTSPSFIHIKFPLYMHVGVLKSKFQSVTLSFLTSKLLVLHYFCNVLRLCLFKRRTSRTLIYNTSMCWL